MSTDLIVRMRKNRELKETIGKFTFTLLRPTDHDVFRLFRDGDPSNARLALEFVAGWEGVIEDDLVGGGGTDPVPFSADLWRTWCDDRMDFWEPIATRVTKAVVERREALEQAGKNLQPA